jgi:hypothetical protein
MTREDERPETVRKVVVVFDICSSTIILEELKRRDNMHVWRNLLIDLKDHMLQRAEDEVVGLEIYKFVGDGWILLLPADILMEKLQSFLHGLSYKYFRTFYTEISHVLENEPKRVGLSFGVDDGELVRLEMNNQIEYLGRPINVAARLQDRVKKLPSYTALFSMPCFNGLNGYDYDEENENHEAAKHTFNLRNISGGKKYSCISIRTLEPRD